MRQLQTILLAALLLGAGLVYAGIHLPFGTGTETFVDIAPGSSSQQIAAQLEEAGVLRSKYLFDVVRALRRGRLQAGEYRFNHPENVLEIYGQLHRGEVFTIPVVVPEGYNIYDIAVTLENAGLVRAEDFLNAAQSNVSLIADIDPNAKSLEGYLFPDTYRFPHKVTAEQVLAAMVKEFRQEAKRLGMQSDIERTVTMASLIEKETGASNERALVASVFENRLAKGMPLATDPSVIYAAQLAGRYRGTIYESDLKFDSPYNTYLHTGLPPGPIANPGEASLKAALNPAQTDYLYFVSNGAGNSVFSSTLAEHDKHVAAYRKAEKRASER
jgi:UPF0755 protein